MPTVATRCLAKAVADNSVDRVFFVAVSALLSSRMKDVNIDVDAGSCAAIVRRPPQGDLAETEGFFMMFRMSSRGDKKEVDGSILVATVRRPANQGLMV